MLWELGIIVLKSVAVLGIVLGLACLNIWIERKGSALLQDRIGANRAKLFGFSAFGLFNTLIADPLKALLKEDFLPRGVNPWLHAFAPLIAVVPVILSFAAIPIGPSIQTESGQISLQLANLNAGILFVFAMGSLAVYGSVLAGWVSNNKFSVMGGLRSSAQMISYEVTMGISLIGVLAIYGSLDFAKIIEFQGKTSFLGVLPAWGIFLNPLGALLFFISVMAETKRAPFDLPESESDLVAGYFTEYSGMKFLLFWLGEFAEIAIAASLVTVLFLGGWQLPWIDLSSFSWGPLIGSMVFFSKVVFLCLLQIIIRWSLPRFRFDQVMTLCWKYMLPLCILNTLVTVAVLIYLGEGF